MRSCLAAFLFLAACAADGTSTSRQEIVRGSVDTGDPAVVALDLQGGLCSGTLITPHVVLTAGHCIEGGAIDVRFSNTDSGGTVIHASAMLQHANYPTIDIGLVAIPTPGPTTPIPANFTALENHLNEPVRLIGFGVTSENGQDSGVKRQGSASLFALLPDGGGEVETTNHPGSGTCYGDSGGPNLMTINGQEVVAGVTTTGTDICGSGYDIGTRVDSFQSWIQAFITQHEPSATCGADGVCVANCTPVDPDCPVATPDAGVPDAAPHSQPDAGPGPSPDAGDGSGTGTGSDHGSGNGADGTMGGCSAGGGGGGGAGSAWLVIGIGAIAIGARRRRRRA